MVFSTTAFAADPERPVPSVGQGLYRRTLIADAVLTERGTLHGAVMDRQGRRIRGAQVVVRRAGREVARCRSDQTGYFTIDGLRGGVYQFEAANGGCVYRLWTVGTAPPAAQRLVAIHSDNRQVRGQWSGDEPAVRNTLLLGGIVAGAGAIPAIIHNNRSERPPGS